MAIEKMTLVNIKGPLTRLDNTILACSDLGCFHPENITPAGNAGANFGGLKYRNPYQDLLQKITALADNAGIPLRFSEVEDVVVDRRQIKTFTDDFSERFSALRQEQQELQENIDQHQNALVHLRHLAGMDFSFDQIFSSKYLKVRFGRLPRDSGKKLDYYGSKMFLFYPFDEDESYIWCVYFTTNEYVDEADDIFSALFFERVRIPDYIHGTPQKAIDKLEAQYQLELQKLEAVKSLTANLVNEKGPKLAEYYCHIRFLCSTFDLRRFVGVSGRTFYMVGFIPQSDEKRFKERLDAIEGVSLDLLPEDTDKRFQAPTKLKNNWFVRPFEMFVKMYGLPSHKDIDPTPYVAVVYSLLFGIMFGDLGQGLAVSLIGYILFRWKGLELGRVMERIGLSSAFFGLLYGSVFGFEHALDGFFHLLGFAEKPVEVMNASTINVLLIGTVALGAVIIAVSILINILLGFKQHDMERAVFSQNGLAGLVFYATVLAGVLGMLIGFSFFNPLTVGVGIVLPILAIFFHEPLADLSKGCKRFHMEDGIGSFIAQNFFELFEVVLSFVANTMSFLRVGGFILSHAGMMAVVFTISEMVSAGASPVVVILGNLFVMCLEGLIVGIQVLRLQFYEMFSRFFGGEGEPFEPISVDMALEN
ncbi:MAG: V-type ATP synthase subunit I [Provencibacterium sp.]|jgi:V/A-type H+-transporting ATPase subunit I|nr:V-type ATP synthase subunit I [Provencibacterium sp.]